MEYETCDSCWCNSCQMLSICVNCFNELSDKESLYEDVISDIKYILYNSECTLYKCEYIKLLLKDLDRGIEIISENVNEVS